MGYTKSSQTITEFLDKEKIKIELDKFAPVLATTNAGIIGIYTWREVSLSDALKYLCPLFGPGGADNSLKALRGWVDKQAEEWDFDIIKRDGNIVWLMWKSGTLARTIEGVGKTDGIALHDLLYKLMEAKDD